MQKTERGLVWVLEDSPLEAEMARRALAPNYAVEIFPDSPQLLERLANGERPNAIVLDCQLPTLPGLEVCRFIRAEHDEMKLPIVMLTVEGRRDDRIDGLTAGANDYLVKPYHVTELLARVALLVRSSQLHRAQARRAAHLALAADVGRLLTTGTEPFAQKCADCVAHHLDAAAAFIWIEDDAVRGPGAAAGPLAGALVTDNAAADRGARVVAEGTDTDRFLRAEEWSRERARAFVRLPLTVGARTIGALAVALRRPLSGDDLESLSGLADLIALGLDRARGEHERALLLAAERRARGDAEAANRSKDEFLSVVSHELRTPLNAIAGWVQMLRAGVVRENDQGRALETIERNARAQTQLIDDLLDVSRIISGKLRIEAAVVDLAEVLDSAVESFRPMAAVKKITLNVRVARVGHLLGDESRVKQIVSNLLANSIKFTPRGGSVSVTVERHGSEAEIRVADSGQGIKPAFLPYVFERFRQAESTMARSHGGLGLGLAIVRHLVLLHSGTVSAHSDGEGHGATFTVRLPLIDDESGRQSKPPPSSPPPPEALAGVSVLVVDDDDDSRDMMTRLLLDCRAAVTAVSSVERALAEIERHVPDVIVSDIGMPGADGFSFLRTLRTFPPERGGSVPAIAVTAYARLEDRHSAEQAGFDLHVSKPVAMPLLVASVARLARKH